MKEQTASTQSTTEALNRMIANLSRQYSLDNAAPVGKYLNVATSRRRNLQRKIKSPTPSPLPEEGD